MHKHLWVISMFFMLEIKENPRGAVQKIKNAFAPKGIEVTAVKEPFAKPFYIVSVRERKGVLPWREIEKALSGKCKTAVLPQNVRLPDGLPFEAFAGDALCRRLLFSGAVSYMREHGGFFHNSLCVFDEDALLKDEIEKYAPRFSCVSVVTKNAAQYRQTQKNLLYHFGVSLAVLEKWGTQALCAEAIISPKGKNIPAVYSGTVFTYEKTRLLSGRVLCAREKELDEKYRRYVPKGTDPMLFARALYELCEEKELENIQTDFS